MASEKFDLIVIGAGPGGYIAAIRAAQLGLNVACIDKRASFGGTCLNIGCIPSKALLQSSELYHSASKNFAKHGIKVESVGLDLDAMMKRKDAVVRQLTNGIAGLFKKHKITGITGEARFQKSEGGVHKVVVKVADQDQVFEAPKVIIATGSVPASLKGIDFNGETIVSSTEALSLKKVPKDFIVIGGGYIGLEMGSVWKRLGANVTVIEYAERIVPAMDQQIGKELQKSLVKLGFDFKLSTECVSAKTSKDGVELEIRDRASNQTSKLKADVVLVCAGRKAFTGGLNLEAVGLKADERGQVVINDHFETSVKGIYAIGDVVRGPMLAHKAEDEGVACAEILVGQAGHVAYDKIPAVVYTWPEVASVGLTEEDAKAKHITYKVGTFPFIANARAKAMEETDGLVKIIADAKTDKVLGAHIIGANAGDLIAEVVAVMEFGGSAEDIARTCHAHPTLGEAVKEAALAVDKRTLSL
ncbi:MAG: dihydrolipoyl dehydrogenase [Bdellovibrionota bacterium]